MKRNERYNVRIVEMGNNLYAVTRRGFMCPYTTEKARKKVNLDFFKDNKQLMFCCEAVGEESPFVPKTVYGNKELELYTFDIRNRRTNTALSIDQKLELAEEYDLKIAPVFGRVDKSQAHEKVSP